MGNTISNDRSTSNQGLYDSKSDGAILFRQKIHDILVDHKMNINGRELYVNRQKAFCRLKKGTSNETANNLNMDNNEYISVPLPAIVNHVPSFTYGSDKSKKTELTSKIQTFDIPLQIKESKPKYQGTQTNLYVPNSCKADMAEICAKQIYDNGCIKFQGNNWSWNSNNTKCFKANNESLEDREVGQEEKKILQEITLEDNILYDFDYLCSFLQNSSSSDDVSIDYNINGTKKIMKIKVNKDITSKTHWASDNSKYAKNLAAYGALFPYSKQDFTNFLGKNGNNIKNAYIGLKNMVLLNYLYSFEKFYKEELYSDRVLYTGEPMCACLNSVYGSNLNTNPSKVCKLKNKSGGNLSLADLKGILNSPVSHPEWKVKEARMCLNWNAVFLTEYNENLVKTTGGSSVKNKYITPNQANTFVRKWNASKNKFNTDANTKRLLEEQYKECKKEDSLSVGVNMFSKYGGSPDLTREVNGTKYSIKLSYFNDEAGGVGSSTKKGPYEQDKTCKARVDAYDGGGLGREQGPYYTESRNSADVTCVNNINFTNVNAEEINIGSILQNNTCGNVGNISQTFITPETGQPKHSGCPAGANQSIFLAGFNITINDNNTLSYDIFGNINGQYKKAIQADKSINVYEHVAKPGLLLVFRPKSTDNTVSVSIYNTSSGNPVPLISSRSFKYNTNPEAKNKENEEVCMDQQLKSIFIFGEHLFKDSVSERTKVLDTYRKENKGVTDYIGTSLQSFKTFYEKKLPGYNWSSEQKINSSGVVSQNFKEIRGIIAHGGSGLFSQGTKFFKTSYQFTENYENKWYLYEQSKNSKPITGIAMSKTENTTLTPYFVVGNIDDTIADITSSTPGGFYRKTPKNSLGATVAARNAGVDIDEYILDVKKLLNVTIIDKRKRSLIIYSPSLFRYILISESRIVAASDISYDLFYGQDSELVLSSANLSKIPDGAIGQLTKSTENRVFKLVNISKIKKAAGEVGISDIKELLIKSNNPSINALQGKKSLSLKKVNDYWYQGGNVHLKMFNRKWYIYVGNVKALELTVPSTLTGVDVLNLTKIIKSNNISPKDYWKKLPGTSSLVNSKPVTLKLFPVRDFVLRFTIKMTKDNTKLNSIETKLTDLCKNYFKASAALASRAVTKKSKLSKDELFIWVSFSIPDISLLNEELDLENFVDYIYKNTNYINIDANINTQTILEIIPVKKFYTNETEAKADVDNRIKNEITNKADSIFTNTTLMKFNIQPDMKIGKFQIQISKKVDINRLKNIIENGMETINKLPISIDKLEGFSNKIEGFYGGNFHNFETLANTNENMVIEVNYFYNPNTDILTSNSRNTIGPISKLSKIRQGDTYGDEKQSLQDNTETPVGTIINNILSGLREINKDIQIEIMTSELAADYETLEYQLLYDSSEDPYGTKIKKLSVKDNILKVNNEYLVIKNTFEQEAKEILKEFNIDLFNKSIRDFIDEVIESLDEDFNEGRNKLLSGLQVTLDGLINKKSNDKIFTTIGNKPAYNDFIKIPKKLEEIINTFNKKIKDKKEYYTLSLRRANLQSEYNSNIIEASTFCKDKASCDEYEIKLLKQAIELITKEASPCGSIEECKEALKSAKNKEIETNTQEQKDAEKTTVRPQPPAAAAPPTDTPPTEAPPTDPTNIIVSSPPPLPADQPTTAPSTTSPSTAAPSTAAPSTDDPDEPEESSNMTMYIIIFIVILVLLAGGFFFLR